MKRNYDNIADWNFHGKIVIAMPLHNGAKTIRRAVHSFICQKNVRRELILVIGNDHSTDDFREQIDDLLTDNITILDISSNGKVFLARNQLNEYIINSIDDVSYIGRLDADDELACDTVISQLEKIIDQTRADVIFSGNYLRENGIILERINVAQKAFLKRDILEERIWKMSQCIPEAELPSCNTFIKPHYIQEYPEKESAEDHWVSVELLLNTYGITIHMAENLLYCIYSLSGLQTKRNKGLQKYKASRVELYEYLKGHP